MQITWHGLNCVRIQGKEATIVIDPLVESSGLKNPKWQPDLVLSSTDEIAKVKTAPSAFHIMTAGEYELKEAFVYALDWKKSKEGEKGKNRIFRVNLEGVAYGHLGGCDGVLDSKELEIFEGCDVLIVPVGNPDQMSVKDAVENVARIEPRIVIPVDINVKGLKVKRETVDAFIKELGIKAEETDKLKLSNKDLPVDQREVYVLELA